MAAPRSFSALAALAQGTGGVDHVVDQDAGTAFDVTDDVHHFGMVGLLATLVDDRQVDAQALGHGAGTHDAADIGETIIRLSKRWSSMSSTGDPGSRTLSTGMSKKPSDLVSVQVDGQHAVDTDHGEHVGHYFGADRHTGGNADGDPDGHNRSRG